MTAFRINDEEQLLLRRSELSHAAKLLYVIGLRPRMDFRTGIVGKVRRVSYQTFHEDLEYLPAQGSTRDKGDYTIGAIRALLDELVRVGLIRRLPNDKRLIFLECLVADREDASKNMNNRGTTKKSNTMNTAAKPSNGKGFHGHEHTMNNNAEPGMSNIPPVSGKPLCVPQAAALLTSPVDNLQRAAMLLLPEEIVDFLKRSEKARGKIMSVTVADEAVKSWFSREVTIDELEAAYALAVADRQKSGNQAALNANFLDIFVARILAKRVPWFLSWKGVEGMGRRYGLEQAQSEPPQGFKARVFAAAGITEAEARSWQP